MKRLLQVRIEPELIKKFKILCIEEDTSIAEKIEKLIKRELKKKEKN
jgi:hypothetical protein